jgi:hypothetical protein
MNPEGVEGFPPGFTAMDVGAIGQVKAAIQDHGGESVLVIFTRARWR